MDGRTPSRRVFLAAGLAAAAGAVAHAIGRPDLVRAANGDPVIAGQSVTASTTTTIHSTSFAALDIQADGANVDGVHSIVTGGGGNGVFGEADGASGVGVTGFSDSGTGVLGSSNIGVGVYGSSSNATAVRGDSESNSLPAVIARNNAGSTGLLGFSGDVTTPLPSGRPDTGIEGYAVGFPGRPASNAVGVFGHSAHGTGVFADAGSGGTALHVNGRATFSRSGRLTLSSGTSSMSKSVAGLTSTSLVFAVVQTGDSHAWVRKVAPASGKFTVFMNKAMTGSVVVAWIAFG
jgi:hypothetical protein